MGSNKGKGLRVFTADELKRFDGQDGRPLYIVFQNRVYDLSTSRLWAKGRHMQVHVFNEDLETTIKSAPHREEVLTRFPVIGELKPEPVQVTAAPAQPSPIEKPILERRDFLKLIAAAGGGIVLLGMTSVLRGITSIQPSTTTPASWPRLKVTNLSSIQLLTPISFNYPLTSTPNFLVKLGVKADNGIGPNGDIVAFSGICQHLGCFYGFLSPESSPPCNSSFKAAIPQGYCCCHGSQYDFVHGARVISGPARYPLPQVQLTLDSGTGDIYAVSMGPPTIFGHGPSGTTDPTLVMQYDLQGGDIVST